MGLPLLKKCRYSDILGQLPEQVLMEIILNLSAGDLQNLKFVSKFWNYFVSNPDFIKIHFKHSRSHQQPTVLFEDFEIISDRTHTHMYKYHHFGINMMNTSTKMDLQFPGYLKQQQQQVLGLKASCDGLLLFQNKYYPKQLYISNPVTTHFQPLPLFDAQCRDWALVFDTRIQKYKVFAILCRYLYTVLNLGEETLSWQQYGGARKHKGENVLSNVLLIQKELHWLTTETEGEYSSSNRQLYYFIFSIHIEEYDKFTKTRVPLRLCDEEIREFEICKGKHLISDVQGSLCLTFVSHKLLKIFVLEDRARGVWIKSHVVRLQSLSTHSMLFSSFLSNDMCLVAMGGVARSNLADLLKVLVHVEDKLFWYDLKTQERALVGSLKKDCKLCRSYIFHLESLISWATETVY